MSIVKLENHDLDSLENYLAKPTDGADGPIKIGSHCHCALCKLAREVLQVEDTIIGPAAVKVLTLIDKMHKRFGQCDSDLLRKLL